MFIVILFMKAMKLDIIQILIIRGRVSDIYICGVLYSSGNGFAQLHAKTWMNHRDTMLSENNHSWKNKYLLYKS